MSDKLLILTWKTYKIWKNNNNNEQAYLGGEGDLLGTVRETEISQYLQMEYAQNRIRPRKKETYSQRLWRPDLVLINKKKRTYFLVNFAIPADEWVKTKKAKNKEKITWNYLESWKKLWNRKVTVKLILFGAAATACNNLDKKQGEMEMKRLSVVLKIPKLTKLTECFLRFPSFWTFKFLLLINQCAYVIPSHSFSHFIHFTHWLKII